MTKIYTYCLFGPDETFYGVYSSLKAVHRDALKLCNRGHFPVIMEYGTETYSPTLTQLRNTLKGECDVRVRYRSGGNIATIVKTKLKE